MSTPILATPHISTSNKGNPLTEPSFSGESVDRTQLISWMEGRLRCGDSQTAIFWAEKILSSSMNLPKNERLIDFVHFIMALASGQQWQTIITFIYKNDLILVHLTFAYFYINALYHRQLYSEIVQIPLGYLRHWNEVPYIPPENSIYLHIESNYPCNKETQKTLDTMAQENNYESQLLLILTKTYLVVQNRPAATGCLKNLIKIDPFCSEALNIAIEARLLNVQDVRRIYESLEVPNERSNAMSLFKKLLDIYDSNVQPDVTMSFYNSDDLSELMVAAYRLFYECNIANAYKITSSIFQQFGYYEKCSLVHIGCLVSLRKINELYSLGHEMVRLQPENHVTWYTVGCYYYATHQFLTAKKFLNKCTSISAGFGEGWLAYGHALYYVDEHEQAMNCFLRATRILEGHFEPLLYIAIEYCYANNFKLANSFLHDAEILSCQHAMVLHERATVAFMEREYEKAEMIYTEAIRQITHVPRRPNPSGQEVTLESMVSIEVSEYWEPLFNNFGYALRKLHKFEDAIMIHRKSLLLARSKAEPWACIGICYASLVSASRQNIDSAIDAFNRALVLKPGDELLKSGLEKILHFVSLCPLSDSIMGVEENVDLLIDAHKKRKQIQREL